MSFSMRLYLLPVSLCFMSIAYMQAYIYQATVMRKQRPSGTYQYVIGMGDYHDAVIAADAQQRAAIQHLCSRAASSSFHVLVEDLDSPNVEHKQTVKGFIFRIRPPGAFLSEITKLCRAAGASVLNLEYRYARMIGLGPVLSHPDKALNALPAPNKLLIQDLLDEVEHELVAIGQYDDGEFIRNVYEREIKAIRSRLVQLNWLNQAHESVAEYLASRTEALFPFIRNELKICDNTILDMKMVHILVSSDQIERAVLLTGGSHLERIQKLLTHIGYETVLRIEPSFSFSFSSDNLPLPIDLTLLDRLFQ